jgi:hypothetical protein
MSRDRAWLEWDRLEHHGGIPFRRRPRPLWIVLHVLLGLIGAGFVVAVLGALLRALLGRPADPPAPNALLVLEGWATALIGWLDFVFSRRTRPVRLASMASFWALGVLAWTVA